MSLHERVVYGTDDNREVSIYHTALCAHTASQAVGQELSTERREPTKKERGMATVAVDYCILRNIVPVIVTKDYDTLPLAAHVVPAKEAYLVLVSTQLLRDLE